MPICEICGKKLKPGDKIITKMCEGHLSKIVIRKGKRIFKFFWKKKPHYVHDDCVEETIFKYTGEKITSYVRHCHKESNKKQIIKKAPASKFDMPIYG